MKRRVALLLGVLAPMFGWPGPGTPTADASGVAVCAVSGTITFSPAPAPAQSTWSVEPAKINCQDVFRAYDRFLGPGSFSGRSTYVSSPTGDGCLNYVGSGEVDYTLHTSEADVHIVEPHDFVLATAGAFTTPSLKGSLQALVPYDGSCITTSVTEAAFVAEGILVRVNNVHRS